MAKNNKFGKTSKIPKGKNALIWVCTYLVKYYVKKKTSNFCDGSIMKGKSV